MSNGFENTHASLRPPHDGRPETKIAGQPTICFCAAMIWPTPKRGPYGEGKTHQKYPYYLRPFWQRAKLGRRLSRMKNVKDLLSANAFAEREHASAGRSTTPAAAKQSGGAGYADKGPPLAQNSGDRCSRMRPSRRPGAISTLHTRCHFNLAPT